MKDNYNHTDFEKEFFGKTNIEFSKSKDEVWLDLDAKLSEKPKGKAISVNFRKVVSYSAAAIIVLAIGLTAFLRFYSIEVVCPKGQHSKVELPDGSKVTLNANSELAYNPYWWKFNRKLDFKGEAFFEVEKGKKFTVVSESATTTVLGTSFNIYARGNDYKVHCITGKVKVESKDKNSVILTKNEFSELKKGQPIDPVKNETENKNSIAWVENEFVFTEMPYYEVYKEIERQFDVVIDGKENFTDKYSGKFTRGSSIDEVLSLIGRTSGIDHKKVSNKKYIVWSR